MTRKSKRVVAIGIAALSAGFIALWAQPTSSFASEPHQFGGQSGTLLFAQANDTKGKSDNNTGRPSNQAPGNQTPNNQAPISGGQPPSPVLQNAPQSGVPARCASITNATERQKCMDTPKGQ
jgi:hypothetical protein